MEKAKRARKAETPRQPSLCLRLRAPYLYPDLAAANEDVLNTSVRKFLKRLGVTTQHEIEKAVRDAETKRQLTSTALSARAVVTVDSIDLKVEIDGNIELA
jgi:Family of unknown function (DUF6494)